MFLAKGKYLLGVAFCLGVAGFVTGCDQPRDSTGAPPPTTTVGTKIDDSVVTTRVKTALLSDPDVKGLDFRVETRKGVVLLSGFADSQTQIDRAIDIASRTEGVKSVDNKVSVKQGAESVGNKVDDEIVTAKVKSALLTDPAIKSFDITVETHKGEVQLSGFVDNALQVDRAIEITRGIVGVQSVSNKLTLKQ